MSSFESAISDVLINEGGFVEHAADPGGATNYGISLRYLKTVGDLDGDGIPDGDIDGDGDVDYFDIRAMSISEAVRLYRLGWWDKYHYGDIDSQELASKVFDAAINMGARQAHICLQRAANTFDPYLAVDGILGPKTRRSINTPPGNAVLAMFRSELIKTYLEIVLRRPASSVFLNGWLNRACK